MAKIKDDISRAARGERVSYEVQVDELPGSPRYFQGEYIPRIVDDQIRGFYAFVSDRTESETQQRALIKSEAQFRMLFEHLPVGVAMVDFQGNILLENEVLTQLLPPVAHGLDGSIFARISTTEAGEGEGQDEPEGQGGAQ